MIKNDFIYIDHIIKSIDKIEKYVEGMTAYDFLENELVQDGVIRNFEIMGEATKRLSSDFRTKLPDIPWKEISGMRDILIHDYLGVDIQAVWDTIEIDLNKLKQQLLKVKKYNS